MLLRIIAQARRQRQPLDRMQLALAIERDIFRILLDQRIDGDVANIRDDIGIGRSGGVRAAIGEPFLAIEIGAGGEVQPAEIADQLQFLLPGAVLIANPLAAASVKVARIVEKGRLIEPVKAR